MKQAKTIPKSKPPAINRRQAIVACNNPGLRQLLITVLREFGIQPVLSETLDDLRVLLAQEETVMVFSPPKFRQGSFREVLGTADGSGSKVPVVVCSEFFDRNLYVETMQLGAFDYLASPCRREDVDWVVNNAVNFSPQSLTAHSSGKASSSTKGAN